MNACKFTQEHEWLRVEDDGSATVGISDYAQEQLGDVVYVELPEVDQAFVMGAEVGVVESVKAVGELYMPISGTVQAVNVVLAGEPELVNSDPMGAGWLLRITPQSPAEIDSLMDEAAYQAYIAGL